MSSEERSKFLRHSKDEMTIRELRRPPRQEVIHSKIRLRLRARVAKARLTRERDMFDVRTIITFESSKT